MTTTTKFEEYLEDICFEENPQILDDDSPDFFDTWLTEMSTDRLLKYGNKYAAEATLAERERCAGVAREDRISIQEPRVEGMSTSISPISKEARKAIAEAILKQDDE